MVKQTGNNQYDTVGTILKSNLTIVETETSLKHIHCIHSLFGIGTSIKSGGVEPTLKGPNLPS
jgi:nicotinic acid phosphoribosyltransferase